MCSLAAGVDAIPHSWETAITVPDGLVAVYKPQTWTSADVVAKVRSTLQRELRHRTGGRVKVKVGHGGTLDPLATGVLVLGIGKGCRQLTDYLAGAKRYRAVGKLGMKTDTLDSLGVAVAEKPWDHVTDAQLSDALEAFRGEILQMPPMFSAKRKDGKRLYDLAREGKVVEREARAVTVTSLSLLQEHDDWLRAGALTRGGNDGSSQVGLAVNARLEVADAPPCPPSFMDLPSFALDVECGGGTYIRSIIDDLGDAVDSCAHMTWLERTRQGPFELDDCLAEAHWSFEEICAHTVRCTQLLETEEPVASGDSDCSDQ